VVVFSPAERMITIIIVEGADQNTIAIEKSHNDSFA